MIIRSQTAIANATDAPNALAYRRPLRGNMQAPIVVVCDPPKLAAQRAGLPIDLEALKLFANIAVAAGLTKEDLLFVGLCPPIPMEIINSDSRKWKFVEPHVEQVWERIREVNPRCIVAFGKDASRVVLGRSVAITKARGKAVRHEDYLVFPMLAPSMILRVPDHLPTFTADVQTLARLKQDNYAVVERTDLQTNYEWREDISDIIALHPEKIAVDTETTGLDWVDPSIEVLTVQICYAPGKVAVCPVHKGYWPAWVGRPRAHAKLVGQLRTLIGDPTIRKVGHNYKYDLHMLRKLRIETTNWSDDTQLKAFAVDENMMEKSLTECTRRWVPELAGYSDAFDQSVDKSRMIDVSYDQMLPYAGGDPDATYRLDDVLEDLLARDSAQHRVYRMVQMPAMRTFAEVVERHGMLIDKPRLVEFSHEVNAWIADTYPDLIKRVPAAVRRNHLEAGKELKFSRPDFVRDTLFTKEGFNFTPVVFTKGTRELKNVAERVASTSTKEHLPFFADTTTLGGQFVLDLTDYQKTDKLSNSLGVPADAVSEASGIWQYLSPVTGKIYPSYMLHRTVTGRTASANPNGQNFPKRGRWAKGFQSIFKASPGFKLVNCDLSQIELRIAAWMARESTMISIYRAGGDIHAATGQYVAGLDNAQWNALTRAQKKKFRQDAKAVNFGFIFGMGAKKFRSFAKTDYNVEFTEQESYRVRERFFTLYPKLEAWHAEQRDFVEKYGHVRALHGAVRHLPSIWSNDTGIKSGTQRQAINSPVQRFGSDLGLMAMARFSAQADPDLFRIVGFIHDALVLEVRDGYEREGIEALLWTMQSNPLTEWFGITPPLPIFAEADIGMDGGSMIEFGDLPPVEERPEWFKALGFDTVTPTCPSWWNPALEEQMTHMNLTN